MKNTTKRPVQDGKFCKYYAYDEKGNRRVFQWNVTNKQDAIHCLVRCEVPSGWYVEVTGGREITNERIYSNQKRPDYIPPQDRSWWDKYFS